MFELNKPILNNDPNTCLVGAGGYGGKTVLGSMAALQFAEIPYYKCLVTRKNRKELIGPDSIWRNITEWVTRQELPDHLRLNHREHINKSDLVITFPSGATIWFRYYDDEESRNKLKSESYDRAVNDEASELKEKVLRFIYRSIRNPLTNDIPLAVLNLSNPGGPSTDYLCSEYVDGHYNYYALDWRHNPTIDPKVYAKSLDKLDPVDKKYQKDGDWHYKPSKGDLIDRETIKRQLLPYNKQLKEFDTIFNVLSIDLAGEGSDKTAITNYLYLQNGWSFIEDFYQTISPYPEEQVYRFIESKILDGFHPNLILIEQEGGSKVYSDRHWEEELQSLGIPLYPVTPKGSKYNRARPMVREMNQGMIKINKKLENKVYIESSHGETYLDLLIEELLNLEPVMKKSPNLIDCLSQARNFIADEILKGTGSGMQTARA